MAKKSKKNSNHDNAGEPESAELTQDAAPKVQKTAAKKTAKKAPPTKRAAKQPGKVTATAASGPTAAAAKAAAKSSLTPTDEDIRLRAYFIAERRHRLHLPGDASSDWLEAKRQLLSEAARR